MNAGLRVIKEETMKLWNQVNRKYGNHTYNIGVNGNDEVVLCEGYGPEIVKGQEAVIEKLKDLLKA